MVRGNADAEIISDLLGDPKTDHTLEETVTFIAQKEQGKVTRSAVGLSARAMRNTMGLLDHMDGSAGHADALPMDPGMTGSRGLKTVRHGHSLTSAKCNIKGHYTKSCSKCTDCDAWGHRELEHVLIWSTERC